MTGDEFYVAFEERHRGSRELILDRLRVYYPFVEPLRALYSESRALDLGCGRGEWLELLTEWGLTPSGVDTNALMVEQCRSRGLDAVLQDAAAAMTAAPDEAYAVVSGFHIAEHVPFETLQGFVQQALRVLKPGGLLILETPNPENLVVGTSGFYLDPTHLRPLPPSLLEFLPEYYGFQRTRTVRLQEANGLLAGRRLSVVDVLAGVSPDYAVIAQKAADPTVLKTFDLAFEAQYGVSLPAVTQAYDKLLNDRMSETESQLSKTESQLSKTESQLSEMKSQLSEMNLRMGEMALRVDRLWRLAAPVRLLWRLFRRFVRWVRTPIDMMVARITPIGRRIARFLFFYIRSHRVLRRLAFSVLNRFPEFRDRLYHKYHAAKQPTNSVTNTIAYLSRSELTPLADEIYAELSQRMNRKGT